MGAAVRTRTGKISSRGPGAWRQRTMHTRAPADDTCCFAFARQCVRMCCRPVVQARAGDRRVRSRLHPSWATCCENLEIVHCWWLLAMMTNRVHGVSGRERKVFRRSPCLSSRKKLLPRIRRRRLGPGVAERSWALLEGGRRSRSEVRYRGTSLIRKRIPLRPYRSPMSVALRWS